MRVRRFLAAMGLATVVACGAAVPAARGAIDVPVEKTTLANGLTVLVHEDRDLPVVSLYIFFRTGSRNERPGITGISHLFEHMMFNGGEHTVGKFDEIIEGNGGSTNGYTTRDFTVYLESFPPPALERVLWLEADRMRALAITEKNLEQERGIVKEERRLRTDDDPEGTMYEQIYLAAYEASTYRWGPIGFMADIGAITLDDAKSYFRTYYAPNNATVVLAGAVTAREGFALVDKYFGGIPAQAPPRAVVNVEPPQNGPKTVEYHKVAELPSVAIAYKAVSARHPDRPALDVLQTILGHGQSSRLHRAIVREKELASGVDVSFNWGIDPELFWFSGQVRPGKSAKALARAIEAEVVKLREHPPDERELRKAKNLLQADYVRGLSSVSGKANQLGFYEVVFGDHREMFKETERVEAVTAADVQRVARTYLVPSERTTIELVPERPTAGTPPPRPAGASTGPSEPGVTR
ncbi:MAG: insulinase family protein [Deltaproteobacteria bacterium]|nr:insulinase family protein [Deltaproteobacteria bacterium]